MTTLSFHKKTLISIGALIVCIIGLYGCASTAPRTGSSEAILPEIDVVQVKENSEEALKLAQEAKLDAQLLGTKLTEMDNRVTNITEDISTISPAKIEEIENRISLLIEALKDLQAQIAAIEIMPQVKINKKPEPATFSPTGSSDILKTSPEYTLYQNALRTFDTKNFKQAIAMYKEVLTQFPQGKYADNCYYWIGECNYNLEDYASAIASLEKVLTFQNSSKADDAQFKLGMAYLKLGQPKAAKTALQKLIDRYPSSDLVGVAKKTLAEIK